MMNTSYMFKQRQKTFFSTERRKYQGGFPQNKILDTGKINKYFSLNFNHEVYIPLTKNVLILTTIC